MADVEKININSTDYDIADAKALRNKSTTASSSFVDTKAGTTPYPTTGSNLTGSTIIGGASYVSATGNLSGVTIYGSGANVSNSHATAVGSSSSAALYSAAFGSSSKASASYTMAAGYNARATAQDAVAVGSSSNASQNYTTAIGSSSSASQSYTTALGYRAAATNSYATAVGTQTSAIAQFSTAVGSSAATNNNYSTYAVAVGYGARAGQSAVALGGANTESSGQISVALGAYARAIAYSAVQIGQGTNANYGTLQFRDWPLVNSIGKIFEERLPASGIFATANPPRLSLVDDTKVPEIAILYTGETCSAMTNSLCYKGKVTTSRPSFDVSWVDSNYLKTETDILIDQEKLFLKFAEISQERIGDGDTWNSIVGGDNSSQDLYFYYDSSNEEWHIEFGNSSFESLDNSTPDPIENITTAQLESDFGVHINMKNFTPERNSDNEIFDVSYEAPIHCNGIDSNASEYITVDYMKFMETMADGDWGFFRVVPNMDFWEYTVDGTIYAMPIIPATYSYDGSEYTDVTMRWEWDGNLEEWYLYINGEDTGYTWPTTSMYNQFGITIESGEEENIEYIELQFEATQQRGWEQFDPIDKSKYATASAVSDLQSALRVDEENKMFMRLQSAYDLNTLTNSRAYHIQATGCTNLPSTASSSRDMFLFVTRTDANNVKQVLITDYVRKVYDTQNYGTYCSNMYVRTLSGGTWRSWEVILTPDDLMFLPGFDKTKKQVISHSADFTNITWQDDSGGGSYSEGSGIDITSNVISVDDLDCGTM